jgi:hypothetical protein
MLLALSSATFIHIADDTLRWGNPFAEGTNQFCVRIMSQGHTIACCQVYVCSHFAQPNSIEFEPALKWRRLQMAAKAAKAELRRQHTSHLIGLMRAYLKVCPLP